MNYSITHETCYRAEIPNGIILENPEDFKALYRGAVRELRDWYGGQHKFSYGCCRIMEGVSVTVDDGQRMRWKFIPMRDICKIHIYCLEGVLQIYTERCE